MSACDREGGGSIRGASVCDREGGGIIRGVSACDWESGGIIRVASVIRRVEESSGSVCV